MWFRKRSLQESVAVADLITICTNLQARVGTLEADNVKLQAAQESIRGRFYALKLHKAPREDDPPPRKTREELLRERFTPGQPARHTS